MKCTLTVTLALSLTQTLVADELVLRSGEHIHGIYYGGSPRSVRFAFASQPDIIRNYPDQNVKAIYFGDEQTDREPAPVQRGSARPALPSYGAQQSPAGNPVLRAGTSCVVRLIDPIDSKKDSLGQTYRASLDQAILFNGQTLAQRGSDAVLVLTDDQNSGRIAGKTSLTISVQSLTINGRAYDVTTTAVTRASGSRGAQSAQRIGAGAGLGAAIGGLAGGGIGAGIGALSGAAAGTIVQVATSGERVKVPSETRLAFTLKEDLSL